MALEHDNELSAVAAVPSSSAGAGRDATETQASPIDSESRQKRVLLVDDDESAREQVRTNLSRRGFLVAHSPDNVTAQEMMRSFRPHLVLLEWVSSAIFGLEFIRWMKRHYSLSHMPVIFLTSHAAENDRVLGLQSGAADYVTKPFSAPELLARINAVLRRTSRNREQDIIEASDLTINLQTERITVCDQEISLGSREFRLLAYLMAHPERVHSREQLLEDVWGHRAQCELRTVDVEISRLRSALQERNCGGYIQTVHGAGYRFSTRRQRY